MVGEGGQQQLHNEEGIAAAQQLEGRAAVGVVVARVLDAEEEEESEEETRERRGAVREGAAEGRGLGDGLDHVQLESNTLWEYSKMAQTTTCMPAQSSACDTR